MTFDPNMPRATGVTLSQVHDALVKLVKLGNVVDPSSVRPVLDDQSLPSQEPIDSRFITVKLPSLVWEHGNVMIGGGNLSILMVEGQTQVKLWLRNEIDLYGSAEHAIDQAIAAPPRGTKLIGKLTKLFWEDDLLNAAGTAAVTNQPMEFISLEPPGPGPSPWKPWSLTIGIHFNWDLNEED